MSRLRIEGLEKTFPDGTTAVAGIDLDVDESELVVLLGPSGCGKSTLLRMVAGIETPTRGRVLIDGRDVTELPPQKRDVAMVFQNYALYPNMTVRKNLGFGLEMRGTERQTVARRVAEVAESLEITALLDRKPAQLSGGQRQRVALGRAIARQPKVFLLDEPLSNLDAQLRVTTRTELARLHRSLRTPMLYVTHDQEEAMTLGHRVVVLRQGRCEQIGTPQEIYSRPATQFVAGFVGSPRMNFTAGKLRQVKGQSRVDVLGVAVDLGPLTSGAAGDGSSAAGRDVVVGVRPEDVRLVPAPGAHTAPATHSENSRLESDHDTRTAPGTGPEHTRLEAGAGAWSGEVDVVEALGRDVLVHVAVRGATAAPQLFRALVAADAPVVPGARVGVRFDPESLHLFDAATERRL